MSRSTDLVCEQGLASFCQQAAIQENSGELMPEISKKWEEVSGRCSRECPLNKLGRKMRSEESEQVVAAVSLQHQRDELAMNGPEWASTIRQN